MSIILCDTGQLQAQETAVVLLIPQSVALDKGQTSGVVVRVEGAANVYGVHLDLSFDAEKIKVLDADEAKAGVQIVAGDFLAVDDGFEAANEVDNEMGQVTYALSLLAPAEPASGSGTLVEFEVEALETGSIDLLFDGVILASPEGAELPVRFADNPENDGGIVVPTAMATTAAPAATSATEDSQTAAPPTADNITAPSPTAESATEAAPATATPIVANTQQPTGPETAEPLAPGEPSTNAAPAQTNVEEPELMVVESGTAEAAEVAPATAIAAAPQAVEKEDSIQVEEPTAQALTVIGQNQINAEESQAQPATPAPTANNEGIMEGPIIAIGLILLIVAFIAIWFLRRLLSKT